ncbi:MAG: transketolase family protein [Candidatus Nanopelagicales bacterium]
MLDRAGSMGEVADVAGRFLEQPLGHTLADIGDRRPDVVALTADLGKYTDVYPFRDRHPDRFFNVGMAEQNLIAVAAGMAKAGLTPFTTTYAAFLTRRALDFIILACAHAHADVKIFAGTPGLVNSYGATHQGTDDLSILRTVPDLTVIDPCDATEFVQVVRAVAETPGTFYVRQLRGKVPVVLDPSYRFQIGKAALLRDGGDVGVVSTGFMTQRALVASERAAGAGLSAAVLHVPTIKPFDAEAVVELASGVDRLVVVENHQTTGGLATLVVEAMFDAGILKPVLRVGIGDRFHECGSHPYMEAKYGLDQARIDRAVRDGR